MLHDNGGIINRHHLHESGINRENQNAAVVVSYPLLCAKITTISLKTIKIN